MDIKTPRAEIRDIPNATVLLKSGDHISVGYIDPNGRFNCFNLSAQHLVFLVSHQETEATMLCRPAVGVQFVEGTKK
jgi:hypothetical protein